MPGNNMLKTSQMVEREREQALRGTQEAAMDRYFIGRKSVFVIE